MVSEEVEGFTLNMPGSPRNEHVCQIVERVSGSMGEKYVPMLMDVGPIFIVRYGDGELDVVPAYNLNPWYPV